MVQCPDFSLYAALCSLLSHVSPMQFLQHGSFFLGTLRQLKFSKSAKAEVARHS
jgi:hypothetical protein